jgi:ferric-dicitrate binding protein FerR (iron transport regulator)
MHDAEAFAALLLRWLDGATTPEEDALVNEELRDEAQRAVFVELCRQRGGIGEAIAQMRPRARRRRPWVAAAAGILLAAGVFLLLPSGGPPFARLERVEGGVLRADRAAERGDVLREGETLETDGKGRAVVAYDDGTRVELEPGTRVRVAPSFVVTQGAVTANVVRRTDPMVFRTPEGEATVLGTVLRLSVSGGATRLEVEKGLVRLTRLSDRRSADVAAGQFAVASAGAPPVAGLLLAPGAWRAAPGTAISRVFPDKEQFPGIQGRMGSAGVVLAWSGGAFDSKRGRLVVWGGGYTDYHGNELYAFDVGRLAWERLTEPHPRPKLGSDANDDGTPNGRATYNGLAYLAHADRYFALGGGVAGSGNEVCRAPWLFDFDAKAWSKRSEGPAALRGAACAYDPAGKKLWWSDSRGVHAYDVDSDRWTRHADEGSYYMTGAIDPKRGRFVLVGSGQVWAYDLRSAKPVREVWSTTGGDAVVHASNPGLDYDPVRERLTAWAGGAVHVLDPETRAWTAHPAPDAPPATPNGVFGRFRYVPSMDAFIAVTAPDADVRFWKPRRE